MKRYTIYIIAMLLSFTACSDDNFFFEEGEALKEVKPVVIPEEDEEEMPVRIGFLADVDATDLAVTRALREAQTRQSVVGGNEGTLNSTTNKTNLITTLYMLCFTKEGIYLGYRKATLIGDEQKYGSDELALADQSSTNFECQGRELFEGTVPSRTARVHFLGNLVPDDAYDLGTEGNYIPGNDQIGGNENTLIKSVKLSVDISRRDITYWGFHGENSSELLKAWLAVENIGVTIDNVFYEITTDNTGTYITYGGNKYYVANRQITIGGTAYQIQENGDERGVWISGVFYPLDSTGFFVGYNGKDYYVNNNQIIVGGTEYTLESQYHKKVGSIVHLVRDRARADFGNMFDYYRTTSETIEGTEYPANVSDYDIMSIDWIIVNGLKKGFVAPFNEHNSTDHFADYYDRNASPRQAENRLTPYDKPPVERYGTYNADGVQEGQMLRVYTRKDSGSDPEANVADLSNASLFLFEDDNNKDNPPKIILKVAYRIYTSSNHTTVKETKTKFHTLMMLNSNNEPCKIYRNHNYVLNITGLPWEGLGHMTFEDAVNSVEYANNRTVSIDDKVTEVNNGDYSLSIVGNTTLLYQSAADKETTKTIQFKYEAVSGGSGSTTGLGPSDFTAEWQNNVDNSFVYVLDGEHTDTSKALQVVSYNPSTGDGTVTFTIGTVINESLQQGTIVLRDKHSGLVRYINVFTISAFSAGTPTLVRSGDALSSYITGYDNTNHRRTFNQRTCNTYKLTFTIPGDFPIGEYPIIVRMASTTLNPFLCIDTDGDGNSESSTEFGVEMANTENNTTLDGETLTGMSFSNTVTEWNYRKTGEPWNFWYTLTLLSKPMKTVDGASVEDTSDHTYTIYFDDTNPFRASYSQTTNVGLFFKIKYFGAATPLSVTRD